MKTNKMRFMSLILTFVMLINVLGVMPLTVSATDGAADNSEAAEITGVSLIVDGVEYKTGTALVYPDSTVQLKVYGTNLQNGTVGIHGVMYRQGSSIPLDSDYSWVFDEARTTAIYEIDAGRFEKQFEEFLLAYYNDGTTDIYSDVSVRYIPDIPDEPFKLGENTVSNHNGDYVYVKFTPDTSAFYRFYSVSSDENGDPRIYLYDENYKKIEDDDDSGENLEFNLLSYLVSGKTYYLGLYDILDESEYKVMIEKHLEHVDADADCYCDICDSKIHFVADDKSLELGTNKVEAANVNAKKHGGYSLITFTPSESGNYLIYSQNSVDPYTEIYVKQGLMFKSLGRKDDSHYLSYYDFLGVIELEAGVDYYFEFGTYEYEYESSFEVVIERHEECTDTIVTCSGTYCADCFEWMSDEADSDAHRWTYGYCCFCGSNIPEDYSHEHDWCYGICRICVAYHDCESEDFGDSPNCSVCNGFPDASVTIDGDVTYYNHFGYALEAAVDGCVITLYDDVYLNEDYDIYQNITIDLNGEGIWYYGGCLNVYGNVVFCDSSDNGQGGCYGTINVFGNVKLISGKFDDIQFMNGSTLEQIIPDCVDIYIHDGHAEDYVKIDIADYPEGAAFMLKASEDSSEHNWCGNYGDGTKSCEECSFTVESKIYSGDAAREFVREAYELIKELVIELIEEYVVN